MISKTLENELNKLGVVIPKKVNDDSFHIEKAKPWTPKYKGEEPPF